MHYLIRRIAGAFVVLSLALGYWVSPYWLLFTAFVGLNLLQSSFTRWCLMEQILERAGIAAAKPSPERFHDRLSRGATINREVTKP